jgi:hypothetical protein
MFARTLFFLRRFEEAAHQYEGTRSDLYSQGSDMSNDGPHAVKSWIAQWNVRFCVALCYRLAGKVDAAVSALAFLPVATDTATSARSHEERHLPFGAASWGARWYSEEARYEEAVRCLRQEADLMIPERWELSALMALVETIGDREKTTESLMCHLAESPAIYQFAKSVMAESWLPFLRLHPDSQNRWLIAAFRANAPAPIPGLGSIQAAEAIQDYGWATEYELRSRIFVPFRESLRRNPDALAEARRDADSFGPTHKLCKFVLVAQNPAIEFGTMLETLKQAQHSAIPVYVRLQAFVGVRAPRLNGVLKDLAAAVRLRNEATHGPPKFRADDVREMATHCKTVIGALY